MNQLPPGWSEKSLIDFCDMYQPKTIAKKDLLPDGEYQVYGANGPIGFFDQYNHEESEVTVTCRGATCGTVNVIPERTWITGNAMVVRPHREVMDKPFLAYMLMSVDFSSVITGTAQPQITRTNLAPLLVKIPPLAEQRRIVAAIEEHFSHLDTAETAFLAVETRLDHLVQACIDDALSARTDRTIEDLTEERGITDGPFGSNLKSSHYTEAGPRVVRLGNIGRGVFIDEETHITEEHYERLAKHGVEAGDLLIASLYSDRLRSCVAPESLGRSIVKADCIRVRPNVETDVEYLGYALRRSAIDKWCEERVKGIGRQRLGLAAIRQLPVAGLDQEAQKEIAGRLRDLEDRVGEVRRMAATAQGRASQLRRSILAAAFSGQLVPQDPTDEPASVLLERIAAERAASKPSRKKKVTS
ncbi:restriction endonuclease subunit S [bacterium]|nr:restriction endonuclease subunit S [bacterium]